MGVSAKAEPAKISGLLSPKVAAAAAAEDNTLRRERFNMSVLLENRRGDDGRGALPAHTTIRRSALFPRARKIFWGEAPSLCAAIERRGGAARRVIVSTER